MKQDKHYRRTGNLLALALVLAGITLVWGCAAQTRTGRHAPPDTVIQAQMRQSVERTLAGLDSVMVNHDNYECVVLEAKNPVMVFFYINECPWSMAAAPIARAVHMAYPEMIFATYKVCDRGIARDKLNAIKRRYGLTGVPALIFYRQYDGQATRMPDEFNLTGGFKEVDKTRAIIERYLKDIPRKVL